MRAVTDDPETAKLMGIPAFYCAPDLGHGRLFGRLAGADPHQSVAPK